MCYSLPKVWLGRIQKYWDKIMPADFPHSSSEFSFKFDSEKTTEAVNKFNNEFGTEESVVNTLIPEGNFVSNYFGVYNVTGTPGELTLLSPEKIDTNDNITVLHYVEEDDQWNVVEDAQIIDGYVWGTLEAFSPIAIVASRKEIHLETEVAGITGITSFIVCEGNPVKVIMKDSEEYIVNLASGYELAVPLKSYLIGGSIDGRYIESTSITLKNIYSSKYISMIYGGSVFNNQDPEVAPAKVGTINVNLYKSAVGALTGSTGAVRTEQVNYTLIDSVANWVACGASFSKVNSSTPDFASRSWTKNVKYNIKNTNIGLLFCGQNNEYHYVDNTECILDGGKIDYLISGGSNARTNKSVIDAKNAKIGIYQSTNRGNVASAAATFRDCIVDNLFIGGDTTDKTVTGTTGHLKIEINAGSGKYNIVNGTENGALLTRDQIKKIVEYVKVSRNAGEVTISDEFKALLGDKYIVK